MFESNCIDNAQEKINNDIKVLKMTDIFHHGHMSHKPHRHTQIQLTSCANKMVKVAMCDLQCVGTDIHTETYTIL